MELKRGIGLLSKSRCYQRGCDQRKNRQSVPKDWDATGLRSPPQFHSYLFLLVVYIKLSTKAITTISFLFIANCST